jgi:hypothetical protein
LDNAIWHALEPSQAASLLTNYLFTALGVLNWTDEKIRLSAASSYIRLPTVPPLEYRGDKVIVLFVISAFAEDRAEVEHFLVRELRDALVKGIASVFTD